MKIFSISLVLILLVQTSKAQDGISYSFGYDNLIINPTSGYYYPHRREVIDSCKLEIIYKYTFVMDTVAKKKLVDQFALQIGNRTTRFYSQFGERVDSIMYAFRNSKAGKRIDAATNPTKWMKPEEEPEYFDYFTNYPTDGKLTYRRKIMSNCYEYQEPKPSMLWELTFEKQTILGYECQSATLSFRGRSYKAWFTSNIPMPVGPWKFSGLPGAILKIEDSEGLFSWEAIGIEIPKNVKQIYSMKQKYISVSRAQMLKLESKFYLDPVGLLLENGAGWLSTYIDGKHVSLKSGDIVRPYIPPLELN